MNRHTGEEEASSFTRELENEEGKNYDKNEQTMNSLVGRIKVRQLWKSMMCGMACESMKHKGNHSTTRHEVGDFGLESNENTRASSSS